MSFVTPRQARVSASFRPYAVGTGDTTGKWPMLVSDPYGFISTLIESSEFATSIASFQRSSG